MRLSDSQRDSLRELIDEQEELGTALQGALEALDFARWDDLPDATLPWDRVGELARAQGIGEADVVWDLTAGMPSPPKRKGGARKRAPKKAARR
ncbi:MAG TPA: hypothetical protein VHG69_10045 [Thermoleophilaceae bacterium]|nr:hypothetical protein [Thermoleophilaceae bacterium]